MSPLVHPLPMAPPSAAVGSRSAQESPAACRTIDAAGGVFVSAGDFDVTGILNGVEPCSSNYWWIPELQAADGPLLERAGLPPVVTADASEAAAGQRHQAARRPVSRSSTAAA